MVKKSFKYKGVHYESFVEACKKLGINRSSGNTYMRRHKCSPQETLDYFLSEAYKPCRPRSFDYKGVHYESFKEACEKLGIIYENATFYMYKHNISHQETLDDYLSGNYKCKRISFDYKGVHYTNFKEACEKLGIIYNSASTYMYNHKCSPQEALDYFISSNKYTRRKDLSLYYKNIYYESLNDIVNRLKLDNDMIIHYKNKHKLSDREILDKYLSDKSICFEGVEYPSFMDMCNELHIDVGEVIKYSYDNNFELFEGFDSYYYSLL